uniref:Protein kinase domain-containing protein n=1 Tax=Meloidogyne hapla TaxID=6305 RepID=A0A1I8BIA5_MELHA
IREQPVQDLRVFVKFIIENATYLEQLKGDFSSLSSTNATQRITHLLRTFYIKIYEVPDKSEARTEQMMASLLQFMLFQNSNIKFFAMGILEILMNGDKQFKKIFIDQSGLEAILRLISENQDLKLLQQILSTLVTLIIAEQTYAENFVHLDGINLMVTQFDNLQPSSDDLYHALLTLKLVSDIPPTLAYMDLDRAISLAIRGMLPPLIPQKTKTGGCISGSALDTHWWNIVNSLGFLRNVCALNEQAKIYFTQLDGGGTISRLVELGTQCFDLLFCSSSTSTPSTSTTNIAASSSTYNVEQIFCINAEIGSVEIGPERTQTLNTMLNDCLFLLALVNKEYDNKQNDEIIRSVSEKLAADERVMLLYQFILKLDETEFQRSVLTSLQRILNCGVSLPVESRGVRLAENLLKYFSNRNTQTHLKKIAVEVLIGLVCEQSGLHLAVITPLLREYYQLPELMDGVLDVDLCVAIMKLTKELTNEFYQREVIDIPILVYFRFN